MKNFNQMFTGYDKPFNMDAITLERINNILSKLNDAATEGLLLKQFRGLKSVYTSTHFKYTDDEKKKIEEFITKINEAFKTKAVGGGRQAYAQFLQQNLDVIEDDIFKLEKEINTLLYKYDLINLKIQERDGYEKEIESDYE
jgi:hypothetical protein